MAPRPIGAFSRDAAAGEIRAAPRSPVRTVLRLLTSIGVATAHPIAFAAVALYIVAWACLGHRSFDWASGATVATLFMTLFIQRAEHRDTQAIHAKLDELLRVEGRARNELIRLDQEEPEKIAAQRKKAFDQD